MVTYFLSLARQARDLDLPSRARVVNVVGYPFGAVAFDCWPDPGVIDGLTLLLVREDADGSLVAPGNGCTLRLVAPGSGCPLRLAP